MWVEDWFKKFEAQTFINILKTINIKMKKVSSC
ncbi:hypothetical protein J2W62_003419 [Bacillus safensis]|nr:hypothetical protein [Bacillus safensis]